MNLQNSGSYPYDPISASGTTDYGINYDEIRDHLSKLAEFKLNGREIRNTVLTARQLANYQRKTMEYRHIQTVMEQSKNFKDFFTKRRGDLSAKEMMELAQ